VRGALKYKQHNPDHVKNIDQYCIICKDWSLHHEKSVEARKTYENSVDENKIQDYHQSGTVVYSMDLQKVMMLPQMEQFKEVVFSKRIVVFNESFVPLGTKQNLSQLHACGMKESLGERKRILLVRCKPFLN
jgi:hypothetical protein